MTSGRLFNRYAAGGRDHKAALVDHRHRALVQWSARGVFYACMLSSRMLRSEQGPPTRLVMPTFATARSRGERTGRAQPRSPEGVDMYACSIGSPPSGS